MWRENGVQNLPVRKPRRAGPVVEFRVALWPLATLSVLLLGVCVVLSFCGTASARAERLFETCRLLAQMGVLGVFAVCWRRGSDAAGPPGQYVCPECGHDRHDGGVIAGSTTADVER
jgi:hypothetical protein